MLSNAGAELPPLKGHPGNVGALVVGAECLLSGGTGGRVFEWALPDPKASAQEAGPQGVLWLNSTQDTEPYCTVTCMQVGPQPPSQPLLYPVYVLSRTQYTS
jgi:hypothetical protein